MGAPKSLRELREAIPVRRRSASGIFDEYAALVSVIPPRIRKALVDRGVSPSRAGVLSNDIEAALKEIVRGYDTVSTFLGALEGAIDEAQHAAVTAGTFQEHFIID
jgi:uncharacterized membrane-anchored protein